MRLVGTNNFLPPPRRNGLDVSSPPGKDQGFSLVEFLIVVALSMVLISFGIAWLNSERIHVTRTQLVATQALEMATLNRAVESYIQTAATLPTDGSTVTIALSDLVAAKLIPAQYASRLKTGLPPPVSPLGQRYVMKASHIDGGFKGVVVPEGAVQVGAASRAGGNDTSEWLASFNAGVMRELRTAHYSAAAFVAAGSTASDLDATGFELNLAPFVTSVARSSIVALAGYRDLQPKPPLTVEVELPTGGGSGPGACSHWVKREQLFSTAGNHTFTPNAALVSSGGNITVRVVGGGGGGAPYMEYQPYTGLSGGGSGADITRTLNGITTPRAIVVGRGGAPSVIGLATSFGGSLLIAPGGGRSYGTAGAAGGEGGLPGETGNAYSSGNTSGMQHNARGGKEGAPGGGGGGGGSGNHGMVIVSWDELQEC